MLGKMEYDDSYFEKEFERSEKRTRHFQNRVKNVMAMVLPIKSKERILDIGTCSGTFAFECAKYKADVVGTDISEKAILYCQNRSKKEKVKNIRFIKCSSEKQPFSDSYFNKIIMGDLVEHLSPLNFEKTISECKRLLKNNGRLIIYTPNKKHIFEILRKNNFILKKYNTHINLMSADQIIDVLKKYDFDIKRVCFKSSHIPVFNMFEKIFMMIPKIKPLFRRRICIIANKSI